MQDRKIFIARVYVNHSCKFVCLFVLTCVFHIYAMLYFCSLCLWSFIHILIIEIKIFLTSTLLFNQFLTYFLFIPGWTYLAKKCMVQTLHFYILNTKQSCPNAALKYLFRHQKYQSQTDAMSFYPQSNCIYIACIKMHTLLNICATSIHSLRNIVLVYYSLTELSNYMDFTSENVNFFKFPSVWVMLLMQRLSIKTEYRAFTF